MADDRLIAAGIVPGGSGGSGSLVTPHRASAIVRLVFAGVACLAVAIVAGWLLRAGVVVARDPEGELLLIVGLGALVAHLALSVAVWAMAARDLEMMAAGQMDPAGRGRTLAGKALAMLLVFGTVFVALAGVIVVLRGGSLALGAPAL